MFQTEVIIFLQSFESDFLTAFFEFFTEIGRIHFTIPILAVIIFGVNIRKGFLLNQAVAWTGIFTDFLKNSFTLPRPANVDSNVLLPGEGHPNPTNLKSLGAKNFFGKLPPETIDYLRTHRIDSWGFPSGHTSNATALWISISLLFKKTWVRTISIILVILIPLSRMYLGRHFLADLIGGYILGFTVTFLFWRLVYRNEKLHFFLFGKKGKTRSDFKSTLFFIYVFIIPIVLFFIPGTDSDMAANLLGLNSAFFLIRLRGFPRESGTLMMRIIRVIIAGIIFLAIFLFFNKIAPVQFLSQVPILTFLAQATSVFIAIWLSMEINLKLGFFEK